MTLPAPRLFTYTIPIDDGSGAQSISRHVLTGDLQAWRPQHSTKAIRSRFTVSMRIAAISVAARLCHARRGGPYRFQRTDRRALINEPHRIPNAGSTNFAPL